MNLTQPRFVETVQQLISHENALSSWRQKAMDQFVASDFFDQKLESYQHVRIKSIKESAFQRAALQNVQTDYISKKLEPFKNEATLVFYNGHFLPRLSNLDQISSRLIVKPLSESFSSYGVFFKNHFQKWLKEEKDPFALLGFALEQDGLFIYAPTNHVEEKTLYIIEINNGTKNEVSAANVIVSCGKNSQLKLASVSLTDGESLVLSNAFFNLEEAAHVQFSQVASSLSATKLDFVRAYLKKKSVFKAITVASAPLTLRSSFFVQLNDERAEAEVYTLSTLQDEERAHTDILIEHRAENCYSRQLVKNLLSGKALSSFEGKIWVEDIAQQTNAYQLNQNCLLSDKAKAYSKPGLEIFADDVKASHGSTTGYVDQEALFYLQSRGLSKTSAQRLLLDAFCKEVLNLIKDPILKPIAQQNLRHFFERLEC